MSFFRSGPRVPGAAASKRAHGKTLSLITSVALLAGCCGYQARPLDESSLLEQVRASRRPAAQAGAPLDLAAAAAHMRRNNPEIREARAAWRVAESVAKVKTPLANPSIGLGPLLFGGSDILRGDLGLLGSLGWTVPLTGIQRLNDQVNRVRADAALAGAVAVERRQYLGLRADYLRSGLSADLEEAWKGLSAVASAAVKSGGDMLTAGQASAVDVSLLRLDAARTDADVFDAAELATADRQALAGRVNIHADFVAPPDAALRPPLPEYLPTLEALEQAAIAGSPELAQRRAAYLVREKEFRLEVRRQTPDPTIGLELAKDDLYELGLPIGMELPIFDRNQPGIHRAYEARNAARTRYRAELERIFARISAARALVETRGRTYDRYATSVEPASKRTLETTRKSLRVGATGALSYFAVLSTTRAAAVDALEARNQYFGAWLELESACGIPLLDFPNAPGDMPAAASFAPPPPPALPPAEGAPDTNGKEAN